MKRRLIGVFFAIVIAATSLTGCRIGNTEFVLSEKKIDNKTVFTADEYSCSRKEANIYLGNYKNIYGNIYGVNLWDYDDSKETLEAYVKGIAIEELTRIACMNLLAMEQGIVLTEEEQKLVHTLAEAYYDSLTDADIQAMEIKCEDVEIAYEHYAVAQKVYNSMTTSVDEEVSDDEARVIQVRELIVTDKQAADSIAERLKSGDDFSVIAVSYNVVERNVARGYYPQDVEEVAFSLDDGMCSEAVFADNQYYFIYCMNKFEEQLTEDNRQAILFKREKEQFENSFQDICVNAEFCMNEEVWDTVSLKPMENTTTDSFFAMYESVFKTNTEE